jgi:hypothetical protein
MQSVPITTDVLSSCLDQGEMYNSMWFESTNEKKTFHDFHWIRHCNREIIHLIHVVNVSFLNIFNDK